MLCMNLRSSLSHCVPRCAYHRMSMWRANLWNTSTTWRCRACDVLLSFVCSRCRCVGELSILSKACVRVRVCAYASKNTPHLCGALVLYFYVFQGVSCYAQADLRSEPSRVEVLFWCFRDCYHDYCFVKICVCHWKTVSHIAWGTMKPASTCRYRRAWLLFSFSW